MRGSEARAWRDVWLTSQVRQSFDTNKHLVNREEVLKAKQTAITALGNYYATKAYSMALEERDMSLQAVVPDTLKKSQQYRRRRSSESA